MNLVNIWYDTPNGSYSFKGLVPHVFGANGKAICYPCSIFKQAFGFELPAHSIIRII